MSNHHDNENIESKLERAARSMVRDGNNANLNATELSEIVPGIDPEIVKHEENEEDHGHGNDSSNSAVLAAAAVAATSDLDKFNESANTTSNSHNSNEKALDEQTTIGMHHDESERLNEVVAQHNTDFVPQQQIQPGEDRRQYYARTRGVMSRDNSGYPEPSHHGETNRRRIRLTWTPEETAALIEGCKIHGVGNWKKILTDPNLKFNSRTAVDLKDRFRTSFPVEYARLYPNAKTHRLKPKKTIVNTEEDDNNMFADTTGNNQQVDDPESVAVAATRGLDYNNSQGGGGDQNDESQTQGYIYQYPNTTNNSDHVDTKSLTKINRKERHAFTSEEDERLLEGFKRHGPCWSKIQRDQSLQLYSRRSTDLRDRFRNRFPDMYTRAGYKGRGGIRKASAKQNKSASSKTEDNAKRVAAAAVMSLGSQATSNNNGGDNTGPASGDDHSRDSGDSTPNNANPTEQQQDPGNDGFNYHQNQPMLQQVYQESNQRH